LLISRKGADTGLSGSTIHTRPPRSQTNMRPLAVNVRPTASLQAPLARGLATTVSVKPEGSVAAPAVGPARAKRKMANVAAQWPARQSLPALLDVILTKTPVVRSVTCVTFFFYIKNLRASS